MTINTERANVPFAAVRPADASAATPLWVAAGLSLAPAATVGLGRFAYGLLLPAMRADLGWTYAGAGAVNSANGAGYLVGAVVSAGVVRTLGAKRTFALGILVTALAIAATGATRSYSPLMTLRFLAGVGGAFNLVAGAALTAAAGAGPAWRAPLALGVYFSGPALGVLASALTVPPILAQYGWRISWLAMGALSALAAVLALPALARSPAPAVPPTGSRGAAWPVRRLLPLLIGYGIYGAGYIAYMTFIVAFLRSEGFGAPEILAFWTVLGISGIAGTILSGGVLAYARGAWGTVMLTAILTIGSVLPLLSGSRLAAYLSAMVFGSVFLSVVTAVTSFLRKVVPPYAWASAIGGFTVLFALGQCIGPVLSGMMSDGASGLRAGLWLSGAILALATVVAAFQRDPPA